MNIMKIRKERQDKLAMCRNEFERVNCEAIIRKEIANYARETLKERPLFSGEIAFLDEVGVDINTNREVR